MFFAAPVPFRSTPYIQDTPKRTVTAMTRNRLRKLLPFFISHFPFLLVCQRSFYHDRTFHTLSFHLTAHFICIIDGMVELVRICHTAATAVKPCKAGLTALFRVNAASAKFFRNLRFHNALIDISHEELFLTYKLMTRVQISPRCHSQVFGSGSTSGKTLRHTRTSFEVDHKVEEIESSSALFPVDDHLCKSVIFFKDLWEIVFLDRIWVCIFTDNRLN